MKRFTISVLFGSLLAIGWILAGDVATSAAQSAESRTGRTEGISGQGKMRFRVLYTSDHLPAEAQKVLTKAHGGFAIDRRDGKGETYFALPGAGIIQISADMKSVRMLDTPVEMKDTNAHSTTIWYASDGSAFLSFAGNDAGQVFTTTLDGKLVHSLQAPEIGTDLGQPLANDYFYGKGNLVPTDVEQLDGMLYVATGYSNLDFVLTARILSTSPFKAVWHDLAFGGKGSGIGQFGSAHGITVAPETKRVDVTDRPNSEIDRFTRYGHYLSTLKLPLGSRPCDVDYLGRHAIVAALRGPDRSKGAPIYILEDDRLISTVMPKEELGLEKFALIHNAVLGEYDEKLYIIAQTYDPGDFAILEQVTN